MSSISCTCCRFICGVGRFMNAGSGSGGASRGETLPSSTIWGSIEFPVIYSLADTKCEIPIGGADTIGWNNPLKFLLSLPWVFHWEFLIEIFLRFKLDSRWINWRISQLIFFPLLNRHPVSQKWVAEILISYHLLLHPAWHGRRPRHVGRLPRFRPQKRNRPRRGDRRLRERRWQPAWAQFNRYRAIARDKVASAAAHPVHSSCPDVFAWCFLVGRDCRDYRLRDIVILDELQTLGDQPPKS